MTKLLAKIFSYVFHPLLIPTIVILILFNTNTYLAYTVAFYKNITLLIIFISTFVIPITIVPLLQTLNIIESIYMENHRDRIIPLFFTTVSYWFCYFLISRTRLPIPSIVKHFLLASVITLFITMIISYKWKISAHMIGIGGAIAAFIVVTMRLGIDLQLIISTFVIISGIIGTARLKLEAHNPSQIFTGFFTGLFSVFLLLIFFWNF